MKKGILYIIFCGMLGLLCPVLSEAQTTADAINNGTQWLLSVRYGIGLWALSAPPDPLQTEFTEDDFTPTYMRDTLEAITALQAVNVSITEYEPTLNWLERSYIASTEQLGQKIKILSKAGRDATQAITDISASRNGDGGFGGAAGYPSNILDTVLALQGLAASGSADAATISQAASYLVSFQNADGGWGFVKGEISRVYYTALVMQALETQSKTTSIVNSLSKAATYLISQQQADGSWGNIADTSLAYQALTRSTLDIISRTAAISYLTSTQLPDGSWDEDPYATALALRALSDSGIVSSASVSTANSKRALGNETIFYNFCNALKIKRLYPYGPISCPTGSSFCPFKFNNNLI